LLVVGFPTHKEWIQGWNEAGRHRSTAPFNVLRAECCRSQRSPVASSLRWILRMLRLLDKCRLSIYLSSWLGGEEWQGAAATTWYTPRIVCFFCCVMLRTILLSHFRVKAPGVFYS